MSVYTIPAGIPFAEALAAGLLEESAGRPEQLTRMRLLLPTRRACRAVRDAFLKIGEGQSLLLPRLQPLGDVDEEELSFSFAGTGTLREFLDLPPALPPLRRQALLAQAVMGIEGFTHGLDHAMRLARDLGHLMDRVYTEGLDLRNLSGLVQEEDLARHWQITVRFLEILSEKWPSVLAEHGVIDGADRRNRLMGALAAYWAENPPDGPVIAAGSTGSIPATAALLKVIARMPEGRIVLPGLDDAAGRSSPLSDTHPQAVLQSLLKILGIRYEEVQAWSSVNRFEAVHEKRQKLIRSIMGPQETTLRFGQDDPLEGVTRFDCDTPEEEARLVSVMMRHVLETPGKTAALVTADRNLARRVAAFCRRWGIEIDDSAGMPLSQTPVGVYLQLCVQAVQKRLSSGSLLGLLRHALCGLSISERAALDRLETCVLRGPKLAPGLPALRRAVSDAEEEELAGVLNRIEEALEPFLTLCDAQEYSFEAFLTAHIEAAESLAATGELSRQDRLWRDEDGESAVRFLSALLEHADSFPALTAESYTGVFEELMRGVTVRARYGTHPRLSVLGRLEARLVQADLIILSGLNEGSWPPDPGHDPFLSRSMQSDFGLPSPERSIGLSAHDFVQAFCAQNVVLTRSVRHAGAPTVPSRWLQKLDTVLQAAGVNAENLQENAVPCLAFVRSMDRAKAVLPCERPAPCPPAGKRPKRISVTRVKDWLSDPYGIYARYILKLKALEPLEKAPDHTARGLFLHDVLNQFVGLYPEALPEDASERLIDLGTNQMARLMDDPGFWDYWAPRFERLSRRLVDHERAWRVRALPVAMEVAGQVVLRTDTGEFTLTARADRIDRFSDGRMAVIDYKSGGSFTKSQIESGVEPQLPLQAFILKEGGFQGISPATISWLGYWKLTGGETTDEVIAFEPDDDAKMNHVMTRCYDGFLALVQAFEHPETPYLSIPDPARAPRFSDYTHLARVQEWGG